MPNNNTVPETPKTYSQRFGQEIDGYIVSFSAVNQQGLLNQLKTDLIRLAVQELFEGNDLSSRISLELEFSYREIDMYRDSRGSSLIKGAGFPSLKNLDLLGKCNKLLIELVATVKEPLETPIDYILQQEFDSAEAALARYRDNPLTVRDVDGKFYCLRLRQFSKLTRTGFQRSPFIRGVNLPALEPVDIPINWVYKYVLE